MKLPLQINGSLHKVLELPDGLTEQEVKTAALNELCKVVVVPGVLVNVVCPPPPAHLPEIPDKEAA